MLVYGVLDLFRLRVLGDLLVFFRGFYSDLGLLWWLERAVVVILSQKSGGDDFRYLLGLSGGGYNFWWFQLSTDFKCGYFVF